MNSRGVADRPHAVCIPVPVQSHVKAMLQFAKLLHHRGFYVTFVNTQFNHRRLLSARGPNALDGLPDFKFETIPDGLPESDPNATQDLPSLCDSIRKHFLQPLLEVLRMLNNAPNSNVPPVSCIILDGCLLIAITAAEKIGVPVVYLFTISACALMVLKQFRGLKEKGILPLEDESSLTPEYLDTILDGIPGMKDIRLRDMPRFPPMIDPNHVVFEYLADAADNVANASAIIVHTFDALEHDVLEALSSIYPSVYPIGPMPLLLPDDVPSKDIGHNMWKEETECLQWLNGKENNSVLYVNFGSIAMLKSEQLLEFAWGLANSKQHFLWVIRPDLVMGDTTLLPHEFIEETNDRCLIAGWCPQEDVLNHPAIGGFLTHCGWNSTLESICYETPLICWPFFADQQTNCRYICNEWRIGLEMDGDVNREDVEKIVRELMQGQKGKEIKSKAMHWKLKAKEATSASGSSTMNFNKLIDQVLSKH